MQIETDASNQKMKRSSYESINTTICSGIGAQVYAELETNVCNGQICNLYEVDCNGQLVTNFTEYKGNVNPSCNVTKLICNNEIVDLKEQHQATNCRIAQYLCMNFTFIDPQNATNSDSANCLVQTICDNGYFYGFSDYGYQCEQELLICNGSIVNITTIDPTNTTQMNELKYCSIRNDICGWNDTLCQSAQLECNGTRRSEDNCILRKQPFACPNNESIPECKVDVLLCNGDIVNITTYRGPYNNCTVQQMNCSDSSVSLNTLFPERNCSIAEMMCFGTPVPVNIYRGPLDSCQVSALSCAGATDCDYFQAVCDGAAECDFQGSISACENPNSCQAPVNSTTCLCPDDHVGANCQNRRATTCSTPLISPPLDCNNPAYSDAKNDLLDNSDWPCLVFSMDDVAPLEYTLDCEFSSQANDYSGIDFQWTIGNQSFSTANGDVYPFEYWIDNGKFRLSKPVEWFLVFKLFNFNILSDMDGITNSSLTRDQINGTESIWFNFTLKSVPEKFWHGDRLYGELGWSSISSQSMQNRPFGGKRVMDRRFIDSPDHKSQGTEKDKSNKTTIILATVLPVVGIAIIGLVLYLQRKTILRIVRGYKPISTNPGRHSY